MSAAYLGYQFHFYHHRFSGSPSGFDHNQVETFKRCFRPEPGNFCTLIDMPPDIWFQKNTHERLLDRFNSGTNDLNHMLVKAKFENVSKRALSGEPVNDRAIWGIYVLLAWHENLISEARNRKD